MIYKVKRIPKILLGILISISIVLGAYAEPMMVHKVTDGDTAVFKTGSGVLVKCRMAYIDTPEASNNPRTRVKSVACSLPIDYIQKVGKLSSSYTTRYLELVTKGNTVPVDVKIVGRDLKNNRMVCEVGDNGSFNWNIVRDGYAVPYRTYIPKAKKAEFIRLETEAMNTRVGLWKMYPDIMECIRK